MPCNTAASRTFSHPHPEPSPPCPGSLSTCIPSQVSRSPGPPPPARHQPMHQHLDLHRSGERPVPSDGSEGVIPYDEKTTVKLIETQRLDLVDGSRAHNHCFQDLGTTNDSSVPPAQKPVKLMPIRPPSGSATMVLSFAHPSSKSQ